MEVTVHALPRPLLLGDEEVMILKIRAEADLEISLFQFTTNRALPHLIRLSILLGGVMVTTKSLSRPYMIGKVGNN